MQIHRIPLTVAFLATAALHAQVVTPWTFVPRDASAVTAIAWRKIADSPFRDQLRSEVDDDVAKLLEAVDVIDGTDRVVVIRSGQQMTAVLAGDFDLAKLRMAAESDGGSVRHYRKAELLFSSDMEAITLGLINEHIVLLGRAEALIQAVDRMNDPAQQSRPPTQDHDLLIFEKMPRTSVESLVVAYDLANDMRVTAILRTKSAESARKLHESLRVTELKAFAAGNEVRITGELSQDQFASRTGEWRETFEKLAGPAELEPAAIVAKTETEPESIIPSGAPPQAAPGKTAASSPGERKQPAPAPAKIKIVGLDEGDHEVSVGPVAPGVPIPPPASQAEQPAASQSSSTPPADKPTPDHPVK